MLNLAHILTYLPTLVSPCACMESHSTRIVAVKPAYALPLVFRYSRHREWLNSWCEQIRRTPQEYLWDFAKPLPAFLYPHTNPLQSHAWYDQLTYSRTPHSHHIFLPTYNIPPCKSRPKFTNHLPFILAPNYQFAHTLPPPSQQIMWIPFSLLVLPWYANFFWRGATATLMFTSKRIKWSEKYIRKFYVWWGLTAVFNTHYLSTPFLVLLTCLLSLFSCRFPSQYYCWGEYWLLLLMAMMAFTCRMCVIYALHIPLLRWRTSR